MDFWLSITTIGEQEQLLDVARFAEQAGFTGLTLADHVIMPTRIDSKYPYTEDGEIFWPLETPWPDPWVALAAIGAATTTLRLGTNICLAALRDPFVIAKAVSTAAVLSGGRVAFGVAAGWLKEEFDLLGVDFHRRGRRLDELLGICRRLFSGEVFSHHGEFFDFDDVIMRPAAPGPIPVWVGGGSKAALRRAAQNDGWLGLPMTLAQVRELAPQLGALREQIGRAGEPFDLNISFLEAMHRDHLAELAELGTTALMIGCPWLPNPWAATPWLDESADPRDLDTKKRAIERFARMVIHQ